MALTIHGRQIAEHGGSDGVRDDGLLASAIARPQQRFAYGDPAPDPAELAAALAFGIARNHPFVDGNKRTAAVLCELFLAMNGQELAASDEEMLKTFLDLAAGNLSEPDLASWLRAHIPPSDTDSVHDRAGAKPAYR